MRDSLEMSLGPDARIVAGLSWRFEHAMGASGSLRHLNKGTQIKQPGWTSAPEARCKSRAVFASGLLSSPPDSFTRQYLAQEFSRESLLWATCLHVHTLPVSLNRIMKNQTAIYCYEIKMSSRLRCLASICQAIYTPKQNKPSKRYPLSYPSSVSKKESSWSHQSHKAPRRSSHPVQNWL